MARQGGLTGYGSSGKSGDRSSSSSSSTRRAWLGADEETSERRQCMGLARVGGDGGGEGDHRVACPCGNGEEPGSGCTGGEGMHRRRGPWRDRRLPHPCLLGGEGSCMNDRQHGDLDLDLDERSPVRRSRAQRLSRAFGSRCSSRRPSSRALRSRSPWACGSWRRRDIDETVNGHARLNFHFHRRRLDARLGGDRRSLSARTLKAKMSPAPEGE
jgi:hypothetical protein